MMHYGIYLKIDTIKNNLHLFNFKSIQFIKFPNFNILIYQLHTLLLVIEKIFQYDFQLTIDMNILISKLIKK